MALATITPMITVYGIPNCDTVKRARAWLLEHGLAYRFHDLKKIGVPQARLAAWCDAVGWQRLLNRAGTTWRKLPPEVQASAQDADSASAVMCLNASVIKRPVVEWPDGRITVGFSAEAWADRG